MILISSNVPKKQQGSICQISFFVNQKMCLIEPVFSEDITPVLVEIKLLNLALYHLLALFKPGNLFMISPSLLIPSQ